MSTRSSQVARVQIQILMGVVAAGVLSSGCSSAQRRSHSNVIEAKEFVDRLTEQSNGRGLVIFDVREVAAYETGHVAGAVRLDTEQWKNESLAADTGLSHEAIWHDRIGAVGVSGRKPVVLYDDGRMSEAARIWFIFQHFGVREVAVVNGGYPMIRPLMDAGQIPASRTISEATAVDFHPSDAAGGTIGLVERQRVLRSVENREAQVFDARTPAEYAGKDLRQNTRGGHLPTAINLPHSELLDDNGRLKSPEALAKILEGTGFKRGLPVITHCDGGGRASLAALAAERAGYGPVLNYYLSFGDWASDAACPVERHDKQD